MQKQKNNLFGFLIFVLFLSIFFAQTTFARSIKLGIYSLPYDYSVPAPPQPYQSATQISWLKNNFDLIAGVNELVGSGMTMSDVASFSGYAWAKYLDIATLDSFPQYVKMVDWANSVGVDDEEMLLHSNVNFTFVKGVAWVGADKFDAFENAKGIMLENAGIFTDKTVVAYSGASPYTTINQSLYVGYELPFDQATFDVRTPAVDLVGNWQYWDGAAWSSLTVADGTLAMTSTGTLSFIPPSDWSRTIVNGSRNKYFIRFAFNSATISPIINTIKGDPWFNDGVSSHCRGWDSASPSIINSGELAYNPTPPANASAKFRHQARVTVWGSNHSVYNFADFQSIAGTSTRTTSAFLANQSLASINSEGWSGMMYDDATAEVSVSGTGVASSDTDFVAKAGGSTWETVENAKYTDLKNIIKTEKPFVKIGANSKRETITDLGDWNLYEYINNSWGTGDTDNTNLSLSDIRYGNMTYDMYKPPYSNSGLMIYADVYDRINGYSWDRANRGPMSSLTKHLIGMNDNVFFAYISTANAWYAYIDDVFYLDPAKGSTLTQAVVADTSTNTKYLHVVDASQFPTSNIEAKIDGTNPERISYSNRSFVKVDATTLSTTAPIYYNHDVGDVIRFAEKKKLSDGVFRSVNDVYRYTTYFPSMSVNFGNPATDRNMSWVTGVSQGWLNLSAYGNALNTNVWRRDFENAIVLHRPNGGATSAVNYDEYSNPLALGGTYYPLFADGTTGSGISSIQLRRSEGAILMKAPLNADLVAPSAPAGLNVI